MTEDNDTVFMRRAIELAKQAAEHSEVPVGAVVVAGEKIVGEGANATIRHCDPTGHAEVIALRAAAQNQSNYRMPDATLYVTIEPCTMCFGAIVQARIKRVVFGATEPKAGVLVSNPRLQNEGFLNHTFDIRGGVLGEECGSLMSSFFKERRRLKARLKNLNPKDP